MSTDLAKPDEQAAIMSRVLIAGDMSKLSDAQRVEYYLAVCKSMGLNPLTEPFSFVHLNGRLRFYTQKNCTDQLRAIHNISLYGEPGTLIGDVYTVTIHASKPDGRKDVDVGAVNVKGLSGDALANAMMKAVTKAKRRVTLSICGLSFLDETELETVKGAERVDVRTPATPSSEDLTTQLEASISVLKTKADARELYKAVRNSKVRPAVKEKMLVAVQSKAEGLPE